MDSIEDFSSPFSLILIYGYAHISHPSLVPCSKWQNENATLRKMYDYRGVHNKIYWITSFLIPNLTCITSVTFFFLICNLIFKNMWSTHHSRQVVDETTKISLSAFMDFRRVDNKYTQQHYFYLVPCYEEYLTYLCVFFFLSCGGDNLMVKLKVIHPFFIHI